jgi:hypothetical protein
VETSVFGGCFDEEFERESKELFKEIQEGKFILVISATTLDELERAPVKVRRLLEELPSEGVEIIPRSPEIDGLRDAYLQAGVVGPSCGLDAEHIASATVAGVDLIVSWNFKHIVHYKKIRGYQAVNLLEGYKAIPIHSPREVIEL